MRVTHVITGLETGGAETALWGLIRALRALPGGDPASGPEHRVVSLIPPGFMAGRIRDLGVPVDSLGMRRGVPSPWSLLKLARMLRTQRPDLVVTWLYHADLMGLVAASLAGKPPVVWNLRCANMDFSRYSPLTRFTVRVCARLSARPAAVLANTEAGRDHHLGLGYHPKRFEVIENGMDTDRFRPDPEARQAVRAELGLEEDVLLAGAAMRFDPMKNLPGWLDAAALVRRSLPRARFLLCGEGMEGSNAELAGLIRERSLDEAVLTLGQRPDVERVLAALDLYLSASLGEGFPNAAAEAMACGVPAALTDVGACARVAGSTGRVVPPDNAEALARAAVDILSLPGPERAALGLSARERVAAEFSLSRMANAYESLFNSLA